jgi:protocatechuate 3,4-dioxygenase beta subunit
VVATAVTAADGSYSFTNLRPGSYTVRETDLGGWYSTTDIVGANDNMIPVTLSIGQTSAGNTFHDTRRSALGDFVWFDADGDGQQDGGEAGLAGVVVSLYDANDTVVGVATSTEEGAYAFTNLAAGSYTVGFAAPAGLIFTISKFGSAATDSDPFADTNRTAAVTLASGQTDTTVDAGFYAAASVSGFVRVDLNGNGVAEEDDTGGIAGVTVQLLGADSGVLATTTTAVDGSYGFTGLRPGAYTVRETDLGGWYSTMDVSAPNDNLIPVTLSVGQTSADNNFHDTRRAALGDFVWLDADGNGQQDGGETGLVGVVVSLYDANGAVAGMATSTVAGAYAFTNLAAGSYTVGFAVPAGFIFTLSSIGSAATDSDPLAGTNRTAAVTLASGQTDTTVDAGFYAAASVSGFVRVDLNGNGAVEAGDTNGIAGVTVQLLDADSNVLATTTTAADGSYGFTDLRPGAYTVRETDLGGWYSTADVSAPNDNLVSVTLSIGQTSTENNFHDTQLAAFGDRVWNDLDGDGAQDAFEPGIANVRVYADSDGSGTCDAGEPSATTAADGSYLIGELATGSYTARVDSATLPAGMLQTYDLNGALDHQAAAALTSGQTRADVDFGYRAIAVYTISGQVRDDYDQSGNLNKPDKPVGGVKVTLFSDPNGDGDPSDGMVVTKGRTDADGRYTFTNVPSGAYVVVETDPTHSYSTGDRVGDNDNRIPVVIVDADSVENDFLDAVDPAGYFYDVADGRIVPGGRIEVSGAGALVLMDGSSGQYMFISTNPSPSTFTITVTPPPGYIIDPTRPALPGAFDPTGGPDPTVLGSYENEGHPGYLADFSAASNTYYYSFTLEPGDPPVINSNFPLTPVVIEIAGTVFHDANRLSDGLVNGSGTNAAGLFANLVDPATHGVLAGVAVAEDGAYRFGEADGVVTNTAYEVILTRTPQTVGETLTSATLPAAWVSTGEHVGAGAGSDGTVDGRLLASTTADGVREVNFGLDRVPDITPVITAVPNVMHAVQNFFITVRATELNLVDTFGLITIRIPKDIRWVFDGPYDPSLTVLGSTALNNAVWEHSEDSTHHIFKSTEVIPAGGYSYFGFRAVWDAGQTRGRYTITSQIDSWSGGEDRIDNNVDAERLDYFIN